MPLLALVNGAPGLGKSTLAQRWVDDHPLAFCLDLDGIRRLIGGWADEPTRSGLLAREMSLAMVGVHLGAGHDVLVPQYVADHAYVRALSLAASAAGARFVEVVPTNAGHQDAAYGALTGALTAALAG